MRVEVAVQLVRKIRPACRIRRRRLLISHRWIVSGGTDTTLGCAEALPQAHSFLSTQGSAVSALCVDIGALLIGWFPIVGAIPARAGVVVVVDQAERLDMQAAAATPRHVPAGGSSRRRG